MEDRSSERPAIVVIGAAVVALAALFLIAQAWDSLGALGSVTTQESFQRAVRGHALTADQLTGIVRVAKTIAGAASAVSAVFAIYAARGHRESRIALGVSAAVVGLAGLVVDPVIDAILVFGAFLILGSAPARAWYTGRPLPTPEQRVQRGTEPAAPRPTMPRPTLPAPTMPTAVVQVPPPAPVEIVRPDGPPPRGLLVALGAVWLAAGLGILVVGGGILAAIIDRTAVVAWARARFQLDPLEVSAMETASMVVAGLVLVGLALLLLMLLALSVLRGNATARFFLLLATMGAAGLGFVALASAHLSAAAFGIVLVASVAAVIGTVLLMTRSVSEYFGDRPAS